MLMAELGVLVAVTVILAGVDCRADSFWRYAVCVCLASAMGIQSGVARRLSVADVNTTVATMTLHDLAAGSRAAGGDARRWRRRAAVVLALSLGAAIGVGLDQLTPAGGTLLTCAIVGSIVLGAPWELARGRTSSRQPHSPAGSADSPIGGVGIC